MQKKLIALAIAGLVAAPAFAQSNVTVYGVVDLTMDNVKADNSTNASLGLSRNKLQSNSSLLGFKGVEDLGNGLKALFQIETSVNADTGGFGGGRDTFVALSSGMGTVIMGNLTHPVRAMGTKTDLNPGATGIGFIGSTYETFQGVASTRTGTGDRQQLVAYVTPTLMGGLTGTIAYGPGETARAGTPTNSELKPYMWQAAAQYENGPIYAAIGYHQARDFSFVDSDFDSKHTDIRLAGKYTLGTGTTISGLWDRQKVRVDDPLGAVDVKRDAWAINLGQSFGPHTIHGGYSRSNDVKGCGDVDCGNTGSSMWTLGYEYALSKRTMIKAVYASIRNEEDANTDFYVAPLSSTTGNGGFSTLSLGSDPRGFGIGLRHSF